MDKLEFDWFTKYVFRDILHLVFMAQVQWSDLPVEILPIIFLKLNDPCDVYRCGLVCVSWKSIVTTILPPFLLLSNVGKDETGYFHFEASLNKQSCSLFNTQTNETHEIFLPEVENSPLNPTCLVLAIRHFKGILAFCRPGDKSWTFFEDCRRCPEDVTFYKGEFYAVNSFGHLFHLHCNTPATHRKYYVYGRLTSCSLGNTITWWSWMANFYWLLDMDMNIGDHTSLM
ncbi:hypothetical protein EZV62_008821 [Acer yangbiense]|uniref:Uncharacterized protein n=1 Tax=Acer yangbiense TaxID=1000413 RepID=A0A5C7IGG5_9ROSI|nr:hypothetical protein EZV62_008821 [Acer yangbiense]